VDTCRVIQVIETTLLRRGRGVEGSPIRVIRQYWSLEGALLWQVDPCEGECACTGQRCMCEGKP
jgi:hypothetical protein